MDVETLLTELYVIVDDFCKSLPPEPLRRGPQPALTRSEVVTLLLFSQWTPFESERAFYRYASHHLRPLFPRLPRRSQFNRQARAASGTVIAFSHELAQWCGAEQEAFQVVDTMGCAVRNHQRRGCGWLAGLTTIGRCNRLGWYEGFNILTCVSPLGVITGFGIAPANTKEQPFTADFLAARAVGHPQLPEVGRPIPGYYLADTGFEGADAHTDWFQRFGVRFITPPKRRQALQPWPRPLRRWHAGLRQIVETVHNKLLNTFRLEDERPHEWQGFRVRLSAKVCLHNFFIWLNLQLGRPPLAFADLVKW